MDRAERIGPTGSAGVEWKTAAKRVKPPSTISSNTTSASLIPACGRALATLSSFTTRAGWPVAYPPTPIPVSGESPGSGAALGGGGGAGGGGGGGGGFGALGGAGRRTTGGGGGARPVVVVVDSVVVVVTSSGFLPMVSTQRKSAPQAGSTMAAPSRRATTRSRPGLTAPNLFTSPCKLTFELVAPGRVQVHGA